ncbi:hypothetical protein [Aliihoeflea sp. PC F10.4]
MKTPEPWMISTAAQRAAEAKAAQLVPLTPRQLRLVMLNIGLTDADVEAQIAAIANIGDRGAAEVEWRWATKYERNHWLVEHLRTAMEFSSSEFDDLWIWAASL